MRLRDRFGVSERTGKRMVRAMQVLLVAILVYGVWIRSVGIAVNAAISLAITGLPAVLEEDYRVVLDPALVLWLTGAVTLHVIGALGPYRTVWWWDHMTHVLSSGVVAAAGYTVFRAVDEHIEGTVFPNAVVSVFILIFVMAFGVIWEVIEFAVAGTASLIGTAPVLTQYGLEDTMKDLVFDLVGGILVAVFGEAYLSGVVDDVVAYLTDRAL